ncbi:hypothetical protein C6Y10_00755 [Lactiplantibacillus pentosus]|jgi:hypothetical protein|nr:hypothetical protein CEW82_04120 [Lactiplantibacillus pentosus]PRO86763.1 hypothetical protein C6Y10_00755 [Lactiplantibacillus pentosus]
MYEENLRPKMTVKIREAYLFYGMDAYVQNDLKIPNSKLVFPLNLPSRKLRASISFLRFHN